MRIKKGTELRCQSVTLLPESKGRYVRSERARGFPRENKPFQVHFQMGRMGGILNGLSGGFCREQGSVSLEGVVMQSKGKGWDDQLLSRWL